MPVGAVGIPPLALPLRLPPITLDLAEVAITGAPHGDPYPAPKLLAAGRNWACIRGSFIYH